jgi:hypothetical protein
MRTLLPRTALAAASLVLAALAAHAVAQAPAPAPAPAPVVNVASHTCTKPGEFPGRVAQQPRILKWSNDVRIYTDCLKAYVAERNATIDANAKQAKAAIDEYNAAVKDFNDAMGNN